MGIPLSSRFRKGFLSCLFILILCLSQVSCTSKTQSPETAAEIRIGMIITTANERIKINEYSVLGMINSRVREAEGIEVNGKNMTLEIVVREIDGKVSDQAVRAVKELINQEGVIAIIGPGFSSDAIMAGEVAEQSGIPLIAPVSIHPDTTAGRKHVFRTAFVAEFQARSMARFCLDDLGIKSAAVFYNISNRYSRELAEMFREIINREGGRVASFEFYVTGETDFAAQLERIRESSPDALYLPDYYQEAAPIVVQAKEKGIDAVLLGVASWDVEEAREIPQLDGSYIIDYVSLDILKGRSRAFVDDYMATYGSYPLNATILIYDAFGILLSAIQHAGSLEPKDIRDAIYDMGPYEGVAGKIDFIDSGDPAREAVIVRFENGELKYKRKILPGER